VQKYSRRPSLWNGGISRTETKINKWGYRCKGPRKYKNERSFERFAASGNLLFRKTSNPQAPLDDALHGLESVFRAGVDETEKTLDDAGCCAIALEVHQETAVIAVNLGGFLGVVSEVVDVQTWRMLGRFESW
jgi:hypothetical protein